MRTTNKEFLKISLKHFSFKSKKENKIKKIYYNNAIYEGETSISLLTKKVIKEGLGVYLTIKGECYFGEFKNDKLNGEGNFFFSNGGFLRGKFVNNKLEDMSIFVQNNGDIFLLNFRKGILKGFSTYFPAGEKNAYVLLFEKNSFKRVIKKFSFSEDKYFDSVFKIIKSTFENSQLSQVLYTEKDIENVLKKSKIKEKLFISSHLINNKFFYCGIFNENLTFNGLGFLIDFEGERIKIGEFLKNGMENYGFIIEKKYSFMGRFKSNKLTDNIVIKNLESNEFKLCFYEKGAFKKILEEGIGNYKKEIYNYKNKEDVLLKSSDFEDINLFFLNENFNLSIIGSLNFNFNSQKVNKFDKNEIKQKIRSEFSFVPKKTNIQRKIKIEKTPRSKSLNSLSLALKPKEKNKKLPLQKRESKIIELRRKSKSRSVIEKKKKNSIHKNHCWDFKENIRKQKEQIRKNYFKNHLK